MARLLTSFLLGLLWMSDGVASAQPASRLIPYKTVRGWGYANARGRLVIPPRFAEAQPFFFGRAAVKVATPADTVACVIDAADRYLIPPEWHWSGWLFPQFQYAGLNVRDGAGRWGLADTAGRLLLPFAYDDPRGVHGECTAVFERRDPAAPLTLIASQRGKYGLIDTAGRVLVPFVYDSMTRGSDYPSSIVHWLLVRKGGQWGVVDTGNKVLIPVRYPSLKAYGSRWGLVQLYDGQGWEIADATGCEVVPVGNSHVTLAEAQGETPAHFNLYRDGLWGWQDTAGGLRIEPCSKYELRQQGAYLLGVKPGEPSRAFLIDRKGCTVPIPPKYFFSRVGGDTVWIGNNSRDSAGHWVYDEVRFDVQRNRIAGGRRRAVSSSLAILDTPPKIAYIARHRYWGDPDTTLDSIVRRRLGATGAGLLNARRWTIVGGAWKDGWLCVKDSAYRYYALDTALRPMLGPVQEPVVDCILWKDRRYWMVRNVRRALPDKEMQYRYGPPCVLLYNDKGRLVLRLDSYCHLEWHGAGERNVREGERDLLRAENDAGRVGLFHPDGTAPYPALNFRFTELKAYSRHVFMGYGRGNYYSSLTDAKGRDHARGAKITMVDHAGESPPRTGNRSVSDPALLRVEYEVRTTTQGSSVRDHFYIGLDGTVYADPDTIRSQ